MPLSPNSRQVTTPLALKQRVKPTTPLGLQSPWDDAKPRRDYTSKHFNNRIFALDATFTRTEIQGDGTGFFVSSADQTATVRVQIGAQDQSGPAASSGIVVRNGFRVSGIRFSSLFVSNVSAQAGLSIEITSFRDWPDDRIDVDL